MIAWFAACGPGPSVGGPLGGGTVVVPPVAEVAHADRPEHPLARDFSVALDPPAEAELACTDGEDEHRARLPAEGGDVALAGLLPDTTYGCELRWPDASGLLLWSGAFVTAPLPEGLPTFEPTAASGPSLLDANLVLVSAWRQVEGSPNLVWLAVADGRGRIRWFRALPEAQRVGVSADWTGEALLLGGGTVIPPSLSDLDGRVLAQGPPPILADEGWHHEAKRTPEGWLVGLQATPLARDVKGFRVDAIDPATGEAAWILDSAPLVADGTLPAPLPGDDDPYHANAVSWVDDAWGPAVWLSLRGVRRILRLDRGTLEVTHQLGPGLGVAWEDPAGAPLPEADGAFTVTHDPEISGDRLLVFDNGGDRPGGGETRISRYRVLAPDRLVREWSWTEPGWFEPSYGSVQTLPDGTILVGSGHDVDKPVTGGTSRRGFVLQLDGPAGRVIRRLDLATPQDSIYRARFVEACAMFPSRAECATGSRGSAPP